MNSPDCPALLRPFAPPALAEILAAATVKEYSPGEMVFAEGDIALNLFVLRSGQAAVSIELGIQRQITVHTVEPGELFGWSAVVPPGRFTASARAIDRASVLLVPGLAVERAMTADPAGGLLFLQSVLRTVSTRLADTRLQLVSTLQWPTRPQA